MRKVILTRRPSLSDDQGTLGDWYSDSGRRWVTIELPWRDNHSDLSCIPKGVYTCRWINSPKHGWCFQVLDVDGRTMIEIHSGNLAGDVLKGFVRQFEGCIGLGTGIAVFPAGEKMHAEGKNGWLDEPIAVAQNGITDSKTAIQQMEADMGTEDFQLTIQ